MAISNIDVCDFIVYTTKGIEVVKLILIETSGKMSLKQYGKHIVKNLLLKSI